MVSRAARIGLVAVVGLAAAGCPGPRAPRAGPAPEVRIALYRDGALVEEDVEVEVEAGAHPVRLPVAAGLTTDDVAVDSDDAEVRTWTIAPAALGPGPVEIRTGDRAVTGTVEVGSGPTVIVADDGVHVVPAGEVVTGGTGPALTVELAARRAGRVHLRVRYVTDRLSWRTSYALIDEGGVGRLHGALAFDNRTGRSWQRVRLVMIDRNLPDGPPTPSSLHQRVVTVPGQFAIGPGAQRLDLALREATLPLRQTLVYDPVGPDLDAISVRPQFDRDFGVRSWPATVDESVLVDLSRVADGPLPAGPVRVFTAGSDGALVLRGEGRLLPPADDAELYTTVAVGRSPDVVGHRRRTDYFVDHDAKRLVEEFKITLTNRGGRPVDVLVREHVYRGQCWTLAYHSTGERVAKEGAQQIGLGVTVPAAGEVVVMYRVLYEWDERKCRASPSKS